jgi:Rod binding domain-containing protein
MIDPIHSSPPPPAKTSVEAASEAQGIDPKLRLEKLRSASVDFEAMLLNEMFKSMESTLGSGGLVGSGMSGSVYSSMMLDAISHSMASNQSLGLAQQLYKQTVQREPKLQKAEQEILNAMQLQHPTVEQAPEKVPAIKMEIQGTLHHTRDLGPGSSSDLTKKIQELEEEKQSPPPASAAQIKSIHHIIRHLGPGASPEISKQMELSQPTLEIQRSADIEGK